MATLVAVAGDPFAAPAQQAPSDPAMDASVMQTESGGDPTAVSPKGAKGRMQVMDGTAADPGFGVAPAADDSDDERERVGHDYLNAMLQRYGGNHALAAAAYNAGPGMADEWISTNGDPRSGDISDGEWANKIPYPETRDYVNRVMGGIASAPPPRLVAVDHDPFAAATPQPRLVPVDHDPFATSSNPAKSAAGESSSTSFPDADQAFQDIVQPAVNSDVGHAVLQTPTEMGGSVLKGIPVAARALGAAELPETEMATGAAPTPEDIQNADVRDTPFWRAGTGLQQVGRQAFPVSPEGDKSLSVQAARTVASIPAYIAAGAAGGPGAVATLAGLQSGGSGADEAAKLGGTPQQIGEAGSVDTIIGIATAAPVEAVLRPLLRAGPGTYQAAKTALLNALRSGTIGASVSAAQQFAQNLVAQQTFDPNRPAGQGVGRAGAVGGLAFGAVGGVHGAMAPEGRVVDPNSTMQQPGRVDLSGGPGPIVDNGPAAHAEPPPLRTEGFAADTGAQPPPLYPGEPPPNAPAGSGGAIRALTGPTDARGEAFTPAPGQSIKVIYPDGSTAYGTFDGADQGKGETISFENSAQNPEAIRGKTLTGRASSYLILQPDDRAPAPPPPKPSLADILDDKRPVDVIRKDAQRQEMAATRPPGPPSTAGTAENPVVINTAADLHAAVAEIDHAATPAQKEAGNYPKAHILWNDMPVTLETAQGRLRTAADGSWSVQMPAHYGYIRQTVGADTEQVDLYMGNAPQSGTVYVVDQIHPSDGSFDEHKILGGFPSQRQAVAAYSKAFSDGSGPSRIGAVTPMSIDQLKGWLANGDTTVPLAYVAAPPASAASSAGERSAAAPGLGTAPPSPGSAGTQLLHAVSRVVANREGGNLDPARMADVMGQPEPEIRRALDWLTGRGEGVRKGNDGRYTRTPQVGPLDLLQFIAANGGIRDHGGELVARNANRFIPGFGQLVRRHGKSFDDVTLALWERGYLGPHHASAPRPEIGVMLDALDRALQGKRIYAEGEAQEVQQQHEARQVDQEQKERDAAVAEVRAVAAAEAGLTLTQVEIEDAARLVLVEHYEPLEAVIEVPERGAIAERDSMVQDAQEEGHDGWEAPFDEPAAARGAGGGTAPAGNRPTGPVASAPAERPTPSQQPGENQQAPGADRQQQPRRSEHEPEPKPAAEPARQRHVAEKPPAAAPATERTAAGEQAVIPGAEKISDKALAERKMEGRAKPTVAQKPADSGLFDVAGRGQGDLLDKKPPGLSSPTGKPPAGPLSYVDETEAALAGLGARRDHVAVKTYLLKKGRDGFEHLIAFAKDGSVLDAGTAQYPEQVGFSPRLLQNANTQGSDLDLRHNHPNSNALSVADVSVLAYRGIARVVAYGTDGSTYDARLTPTMAAALARRHTANQARVAEIKLIAMVARDAAGKVLKAAASRGRITADHANFMHPHAVSMALAKAAVLDYRATLADNSRAEHPLFDEAVAAAQADVEKLLQRNHYFEVTNEGSKASGAEVAGRPTRILRAPENVGGVLGGDEESRPERPGGAVGDRGGRQAPSGPRGRRGTRSRAEEGWEGLEAPEPLLPERVREHGEGLKKSLQLGREFVQTAVKAFQLEAVPMAAGSDTARTIATDYANEDRLARARMSRLDQLLEKEFKPEERELMGRALEEQSVAALRGEEAAPKTGLARLNKKQRDAVEDLDKLSGFLWDRAIDVGLVQEGRERIPYYFPRMAVLLLTGGEIGRLAENRGEVGRAIEQLPANLRTTTANLKRRQYETAAETEAAIRAKFGDAAALVKDIRALPLALGRLERAIAGRNLVNQIKEVGRMVGTEWVSDNYQDGWFTIDHPSFRTARPRFKLDEATGKTVPVLDEAGEIVFDRVPLHIHPDFRGPLLAIFTKPNGPIYRGLMALKSRAVMSIMYSPAIHNMVELGRAFPLMPGQFLKIRMMGGWLPLPVVHPYMVGYRARHDDEFMDYMISHGLVPMDRSRGHVQDITDVAEAPQLIPGRGLVGKGLRIGLSKINKEAALDAARAVDRFGDIWHKTLLWDRIADLQAGIAKFIMDEAIKDGLPKPVAARIASHIANRFAGALPQEAMSQFARKLFNIMLFSRTFTLGNLAAMKDAVTGLPRNVQAQIKRDFAAMGGGGGGGEQPPAGGSASGAADKGPEGTLRRANNKARKFAARKALGAVITDILLYFILSSLVQNFFDWWNRNQSGWDIADGYLRRLRRLGRAALHNPFDVLNPITDLQALTPMSENEPGKQDRIYVGRGADGRGIYITNPIGRLGLEFISWLLEPLDMIRRKLSTLVRPVEQTVANDAGFGHQVYDPDASGFVGHLQQLGDVAWNFLKQQVPTQPFTAIGNLMRDGTDKGLEAVKLLLPVLGISVSSGYPGGPAAGDLAHEKARQSQQIRAAYGDVAKMVEAGDTDKASERLEQLGMDPKEINATIKALQNPEARITSRKLDRFERSATPDEQERLDQHLDEDR